MSAPLLLLAGLAFLAVMSLGVAAELRRQTVGQTLAAYGAGLRGLARSAWREHPQPGVALLLTGLWLAGLGLMLEHVYQPGSGWVAGWVWSLTIVPHELGHVVSIPFGRYLTIFGGSFWQIAVFLIPAALAWWIRGRVNQAMIFVALAGHSFIDLSVYIRDAQERDLPLLFGLGEDAHDWWNLLRPLGLLPYDNTLSDVAIALGVIMILAATFSAILGSWLLPYEIHPAHLWAAVRAAARGEPTYRGRGAEVVIEIDGLFE